MRRVRMDGRAAARFRSSLHRVQTPSGYQRGAAKVCAIALFLVLAHAVEMTGSFRHGASHAVRAVRPESAREVNTSESSVNSAFRLVVAVAALVATTSASAADLPVPSKLYPTIQSAIDASADGDAILIAPGVYPETLRIEGKAITLVGTGAGLCLVDGAGISSGAPLLLYSNAASATASAISGITFQNGGTGGVVLHGVRNLVMHDCEIRACTATYGAALIPDGGNAVFERVVFRSNVAFNGGAVNTNNGFHGSFRHCAFVDNIATNTGGALIDFYSNSTLVDCLFRGNHGGAIVFSYIGSTTSVGGGAFCGNTGSPLAACCGGSIVDLGGNGSAPACSGSCSGDITLDGVVDGRDLALLLYAWGTEGSQYPGADVDANGIVDGGDLGVVLAAWGPCPQ